jgi:putative ABC transport system ATP-binding protein
MESDPAIDVRKLGKAFGTDAWLFQGLTFQQARGEQVALLGESGVGKSTLLNLLAGLEPADRGEVLLLGRPLQTLTEPQRLQLRRREIGFVFQAFHLLPHLSALQNVMVPCLLNAMAPEQASEAAQEWLTRLGLAHRSHAMPSTLSGGEQQRVAVARALVHRPALVFADEPTGNLDPATAHQVLEALSHACRSASATLLMVTHSLRAAAMLDRQLVVRADGIQPARPAADGQAH